MPLRVIMRNRRTLAVVAWLIATACLVVFLANFDASAALHQIARAQPLWVLSATLANFLILPLLTEQWARLLPKARPMRWSVLWECVTLGIAAMNTLPFGGGHAVAVGILSRRNPAGLPGAVSLLGLEQLCEAFAKLALLFAALAVAPLPDPLPRIGWGIGFFLAIGTGVLVWIVNHPREGDESRGWRAKWSKHLEVVRHPRLFATAVGLSVLMKVCELGSIYCVQRSLGIELPITTAPLILAVVTLASAFSVTPGNLGVYETAAFGVYRFFGVSPDMAIALGLVQHACFLVPIVGAGYLLTVWRTLAPSRVIVSDVPETLT